MFDVWTDFLYPLFGGTGYTPATTAFMAVLFLLGFYAFWIFSRSKEQVAFRRAFFPWMIVGGMIRFLDPRLAHTALLRTPALWVLVAVSFFLFSLRSLKAAEYAGWVLFLLVLPFDFIYLNFARWLDALAALAVTAILFQPIRKLKWMEDVFAWLPHLFEAWVTSFGVFAGLHEEHVVANTLMSINPFLFGLVKTAVILAIFYFLSDLKGDEKTYTGTAIAAIAVGPSIRDLLELLSL